MKRILFIVAALLMAAVIFPAFSRPALAATQSVSNLIEFKAALSSASNGDVIEVTADITLDGQVDFNRAGVTVTLKGSGGVKTIKAGDGGYGNGMFYITSGTIAIENITLDCDGKGRGIDVYSSGAGFEMKSGSTITNGAAGWGGGVQIRYGMFNMSGGTISNNVCSGALTSPFQGGGVYVSDGTFNMSGGTISNNTAPNNSNGSRGGGVFLVGGTFNMSGGTISNNIGAEGGGVYGGTLNMTGECYIMNNTSTGGRGGGVYTGSTNTLKMTGGYINVNNGGGVYMAGTFIMGTSDERVQIVGNTVGDGGYQENDNLRLTQGKVINVESEPAPGSLIWVRFSPDPIASTVLNITNNSSAVSGNNDFFKNMFAPDKPGISEIEISGGVIKLCVTIAQVPVLSALKDRVYNQYADTEELNVNARVTDGGTLSYQWYRNRLYRDTYGSESIYGATTDGYQPDRDRIEIMYYYVVVTNTLKPGNTQSAISNIVKITIKNPDDPDPVDPGFDTINGTITLSDATAPNINLAAETINLGNFSVAAYSLDGGKKWKKGELPTDAKFKKLFDKGMTLWLSDGWNAKDIKEEKKVIEKKGIPANANIIKFPKIEKRPKPNTEKLKPFYLSETWEARKGGTTAASMVYEWAETTDKKTPSGEWQTIPNDGFSIQSGKTKVTYLFRTPAVADGGTYTPASKAFKLTPANFGKAPNYKIKTDKNTEKQTIKLKAGDYYQIGDAAPVKASAGDFDVTSLSGIMKVWKGETGKKTRSEKQEISLT